MAAAADLTVKKNDGSTDITFNVLSQSNGDGTFAKWRQDTGNTAPNAAKMQYWFRAGEKPNGKRYCEHIVFAPYFYTDSNTSQVIVSPLVVMYKSGQWHVPQGIPTSFTDEVISQGINLMSHASVKSAIKTQTSFT